MKLGIKTTDGVAKLKTKTTDGVVKAVECACCKCNPDALWGPGYDDQPSEIQVLGFTLWRVSSCDWRAATCGNCAPDFEAPYCPDGCDQFEVAFLSLNTGDIVDAYPDEPFIAFNKFIGEGSTVEFVSFIATRTGGDHPAPYGVYTVDQDTMDPFELYETITISPP